MTAEHICETCIHWVSDVYMEHKKWVKSTSTCEVNGSATASTYSCGWWEGVDVE